MESERLKLVRKFWHEFFNEQRMEAFDELAHPDYRQNGKLSNGDHLKKWAAELFQVFEVRVVIVHEIEYEDKVAVYWVASLAPHNVHGQQISTHGMNILEFKEDRVVNNWHIRNTK